MCTESCGFPLHDVGQRATHPIRSFRGCPSAEDGDPMGIFANNPVTTNDSSVKLQNLPDATANLIDRLDLPEEVSSQEAAAILGCCKHTVLQYLEEGLLERRNIAPPSSDRPVYRITLRSVTELRLGYQRGSSRPARPITATKKMRRSKPASDYKPKHLRRKNRDAQ
jgi:hypothetical protein